MRRAEHYFQDSTSKFSCLHWAGQGIEWRQSGGKTVAVNLLVFRDESLGIVTEAPKISSISGHSEMALLFPTPN